VLLAEPGGIRTISRWISPRSSASSLSSAPLQAEAMQREIEQAERAIEDLQAERTLVEERAGRAENQVFELQAQVAAAQANQGAWAPDRGLAGMSRFYTGGDRPGIIVLGIYGKQWR
jgi:hypothetical protein